MIKNIKIKEVENCNEKKEIAKDVLCDLPEWFENEKAIENYIEKSSKMPFIGGFIGDKPVAFIVLNKTSDETCEIFVMGVKKDFHRLGIGKLIYEQFEQLARNLGFSYVQVKTVASGYYKEYDLTNKFYKAMGFAKLEILKDLRDEANPCQIYIKYLYKDNINEEL